MFCMLLLFSWTLEQRNRNRKAMQQGGRVPAIVVCLQVRLGYVVHSRNHKFCQVFNVFWIAHFLWLNWKMWQHCPALTAGSTVFSYYCRTSQSLRKKAASCPLLWLGVVVCCQGQDSLETETTTVTKKSKRLITKLPFPLRGKQRHTIYLPYN